MPGAGGRPTRESYECWTQRFFDELDRPLECPRVGVLVFAAVQLDVCEWCVIVDDDVQVVIAAACSSRRPSDLTHAGHGVTREAGNSLARDLARGLADPEADDAEDDPPTARN